MAFNDSQKDVKSLLALLKSTQDGSQSQRLQPPANPPQPTQWSTHPHPSITHHSRPSSTSTSSVIPTQRQLDDLLASLNKPSSSSSSTHTSTFSRPRQSLIEPFGPVGQSIRQPALFDPQLLPPITPDHSLPGPSRPAVNVSRVQKVDRDQPGFETMSFTKALPIISDLLSDDEFRLEVKKMKAGQDALERRLWAKQERLKAEHEKQIQVEKDISNIARKPIPPDTKAQFNRQLDSNLEELFLVTCFPSIDGLALRQREKLREMGVPGLGGDMGDVKARERVRRIMDVLQGGMDD